MKQITHTQHGFTLIELMTSLAIFSIVMTLAMGSILSIFSANRRTQNESLAMNNLNLAIETMARDMRFGTKYHCGGGTYTTPQDCSDQSAGKGGDEVSFLSSDGRQVVYKLQNSQLLRSDNGGGSYVAVTAQELTIKHLEFHVFGASPSDTLQPKVVILVSGSYGSKDTEQVGFSLQTVVSQRTPDNGS